MEKATGALGRLESWGRGGDSGARAVGAAARSGLLRAHGATRRGGDSGGGGGGRSGPRDAPPQPPAALPAARAPSPWAKFARFGGGGRGPWRAPRWRRRAGGERLPHSLPARPPSAARADGGAASWTPQPAAGTSRAAPRRADGADALRQVREGAGSKFQTENSCKERERDMHARAYACISGATLTHRSFRSFGEAGSLGLHRTFVFTVPQITPRKCNGHRNVYSQSSHQGASCPENKRLCGKVL